MPSIAVRRTEPRPSAPSAGTSRHEQQQSQPSASPPASPSPDCCAYCGRGRSSESSLHHKTVLDEQSRRIAALVRELGDRDRRIADLERAVAAAEDAEAEAEAKLEALTGGIGVAPPAARKSSFPTSSPSSSAVSSSQAASRKSPASSSSSAQAPSFAAWGNRFEQLRQFHVRNGHFRVKRNTKLWAWVNIQRLEYKRVIAQRQQQRSHDTSNTAMERGVAPMSSGSNIPLDRPPKLTPDQIVALDSINFKSALDDFSEGTAKKAAKIAVAKASEWDVRIDQCKAFKAKYGHLSLGGKGASKNLRKWALGVRIEYRKWKAGEPSKLTDEQRAGLDGLGFVWDGAAFQAEQARRRFEAMLAEFVRFKREHGPGWESKLCQTIYPKLFSWVNHQRVQYRKRESGDQSFMTDEKVKKLEAAGFEWERQYADDSDSDSDSGEDGEMEVEGSEGKGTEEESKDDTFTAPAIV